MKFYLPSKDCCDKDLNELNELNHLVRREK